MKFRKKPVEIEAIQFDGLNHDAVADFCAPKIIKVGGNFTLLIPTLEGEMTASKGDWIIKGVKGEFYPCKPDIFQATYILADVAKSGVQLISDERKRQIEEEGWTPGHDDEHGVGDLACAAIAYTYEGIARQGEWTNFCRVPRGQVPKDWPWAAGWWKPKEDPVRNLVIAGALIAAEIDKLQRRIENNKEVDHV